MNRGFRIQLFCKCNYVVPMLLLHSSSSVIELPTYPYEAHLPLLYKVIKEFEVGTHIELKDTTPVMNVHLVLFFGIGTAI